MTINFEESREGVDPYCEPGIVSVDDGSYAKTSKRRLFSVGVAR